jgi:hypothetical protein
VLLTRKSPKGVVWVWVQELFPSLAGNKSQLLLVSLRQSTWHPVKPLRRPFHFVRCL